MKLTIYGDVPSKKNSKQIFRNRATGKPFIKSSERYEAWHRQALPQLHRTPRAKDITAIAICFYPATKRRSDLTNKAESIMDLLVDAGVIEDDNWFVVPDIHPKFGGVDKENPRAEVEIISN